MSTPAQAILTPLQVDNTTKADAWEAFNSAKNETDLQVKLMGIKGLPDTAKADLWEAKKGMASPQGTPIASTAKLSPTPKPGIFSSSDPEAIGAAMGKPIRDYLTEAQNLTPEGQTAQPVKAAIGKAVGFAFGGSQGIGTNKGGILTNPILGMIMGTGPGEAAAGAIASKIPNAERAGVAINKITSAAKDLKVPLYDANAAALRAKEIADAGTGLPKPISNFLRRVLNPDKPPVSLEEARDFYTNISKLTGKEWSEFNAPMKRQVATFAKALGDNIEQALTASRPGEGTALRGAMDEYHNAMLLKSMGGKALKIGGGLLTAGGAEEALRYLWRTR